MKFTVKRKELLRLLGDVKRVVPSRTVLPVIQTVHLEARKGLLIATATDLEVALKGKVKATTAKTGAICVYPKPLIEFLKAVGAEDVTLSKVGEKGIKVQAGSAIIISEGYKAEDFPPIPDIVTKPITLTGLKEALGLVDCAMATNDSRPVLQAVCFSPADKSVELAAADGFRLAITNVKAKGVLATKVAVPFTAIKLLKYLANEKTEMAVQEFGSGSLLSQKVAFIMGDMALITNGVSGSYPNYSQLIPADIKHRLKVDATELKQALKTIMAIDPDSGITRFVTNGKGLTLSATDGESTTNVQVAARGKVKIAFNCIYIRDFLDRVDGEVVLETTMESAPGTWKVPGFIYVVMPMHIQW